MPNQYLVVKEIAEETRSCEATVRQWIRVGKLRAARIGRRLLVSREELDKLLAGSECPSELQLGDRRTP